MARALALTLDSILLDRVGDWSWHHNRSLLRLLADVATRGENTLIDGVAGEDPNVVRTAQVVYDLELLVFGAIDHDGDPHPNQTEGLAANLIYLREQIGRPPSSATVSASLAVPGGGTYTTSAQVLNWQLARDDGVALVIAYDLRVPSGVWTLTPP